MDLQNLQENYLCLLSYMEAQHYSNQYIKFIEKEINWILNESARYKWRNYDDVYRTYTKIWTNKHTQANRLRGLLVIERFDLESKMPDGKKHNYRLSNYDFLCKEYKCFIDTYRSIEKREITTSYCKSIEYLACSFLSEMQKNGIECLEQITEKNVLDIFSKNGKLLKSYDYKYGVQVALKTCSSFYPNKICLKILSYLPAIPNTRKNVQYLTVIEIEKIKFVLEEDSSISLQNKAIGLLAFYTGLRSSDIAGLTFNEIDWESDLIRIEQQKTGAPLVLPLRTIVGNALFDYITKERPQSPENTIFLTVNAPYRKLHTTNLNAICVTLMNRAGIRNNPGDRKGFHLFRHHLATTLLQHGIEQPVISSTLGHQSPESLTPYLSADFSHLKECALSIDGFPAKKEVFQL